MIFEEGDILFVGLGQTAPELLPGGPLGKQAFLQCHPLWGLPSEAPGEGSLENRAYCMTVESYQHCFALADFPGGNSL